MLYAEFIKTINDNEIIKAGDKVVVGVSGGADSVCLLHLLVRLRQRIAFELICVHINHMIRDDADNDMIFVKSLCAEWDIPFLLHKQDVLLKAKKENISVELAGREVRYTFLKSIGADVILTAHTKNDLAESVLLHLIRGCGLKGLCGMSIKREDGICRPLLIFERDQIEKYLIEHQIKWHEDKTNLDKKYTRNKIRHDIIPQILEINPSFYDTISRMTKILDDENKYLTMQSSVTSCLEETKTGSRIYIPGFLQLPGVLQKRILASFLDDSAEIDLLLELIQKENGKKLSLSGKRIAEKDYDYINISGFSDEIYPCVNLPDKGFVIWGEYKITVGEEGIALPKDKYYVRARQNGDIFSPEGMRGHKKLKDYFNDIKIPRNFRDKIPIIVCNGKIASVSNYRRDNAFVPTNTNIIKVKIENI